MKSKRVTRLLAFGLAVCMTSVPVFASADNKVVTTQTELDKEVTVNAGFEAADVIVRVSVPTKATVRVQPLGDGVGDTVSQSSVATKDLRFENKTFVFTDEEKTQTQGVPVRVSAKAKFTEKKDDVTLYYDTTAPTTTDDRFKDSCEKKNMWLQLCEGAYATPSSNSSNVTYSSAEKSVVTELGSKIIFTVSGPSVVSAGDTGNDGSNISENASGKAAMAIKGIVAKNAKWAKDDTKVELTYLVQTSGGDDTQTNEMGSMTATNAGLVTIPKATLNGCEITSLAVQDAKSNSYGVQQLTPNNIEVDTTVTNGDMKFQIKSDTMNAINSVKQTPTNFLVGLDDGRVLIASFTTPNN